MVVLLLLPEVLPLVVPLRMLRRRRRLKVRFSPPIMFDMILIYPYREGGVRRGYGFRSFRLSDLSCERKICSRLVLTGRGFWEEWCDLQETDAFFGCDGSCSDEFTIKMWAGYENTMKDLPLPTLRLLTVLCLRDVYVYTHIMNSARAILKTVNTLRRSNIGPYICCTFQFSFSYQMSIAIIIVMFWLQPST